MDAKIDIPLHAFQTVKCTAKVQDVDAWGEVVLQTCNGVVWQPLIQLKKYKGILSNNRQVFVQVPVLQCMQCRAIKEMETDEN